jgi:glycosyltransferase involved in cell wall biosynthesis
VLRAHGMGRRRGILLGLASHLRRDMRIAIITECPEGVGSTYFRALQHVERLEQRGAKVDLFVPDTVAHRMPGQVGRVLYFGEHAIRYLRQGLRLRKRLPEYDAVFVQRGGYPMGPAWVVTALQRFPGRVVLDLDDNVFVTSPRLATKSRAARWLYGAQQARYLVRRADALVVSVPELDRSVPGRSADFVLPSVPDVSDYPTITHRQRAPVRVGWVGNPGNLIYLDFLRDVFERLRSENVAVLEVLCPEPWDGPAMHRPWRREDEVAALASYDIGIMPLPDTPYTRAKAGLKMLLYMGVGSAVITSPVGINVELVENSGGGILAGSAEEWEAALRRLAGDAALRKSLGSAGQQFMRSYADMDAQADTLMSALRG